MQHLKIGYSDVLNMPTSERRFHLGMLVKTKKEEQERAEEMQNKSSSGGKGTRKTKIGGEALKSKIKSGEVPLT
jgi:hypothetical protein